MHFPLSSCRCCATLGCKIVAEKTDGPRLEVHGMNAGPRYLDVGFPDVSQHRPIFLGPRFLYLPRIENMLVFGQVCVLNYGYVQNFSSISWFNSSNSQAWRRPRTDISLTNSMFRFLKITSLNLRVNTLLNRLAPENFSINNLYGAQLFAGRQPLHDIYNSLLVIQFFQTQ